MRRVRRMPCAEYGQVRFHPFDIRGIAVEEWVRAPPSLRVLRIIASAIDERVDGTVLRARGGCDQQIVTGRVTDTADQDGRGSLSRETEWPIILTQFMLAQIRDENRRVGSHVLQQQCRTLAAAGILGAMPKPAIENDGLAVADSRLDELSGGIDLARPIRHHGGRGLKPG